MRPTLSSRRTAAILPVALMIAMTLVLIRRHDSAAQRPVRFSVTGKAVGLFPGATRPLRVTVKNPHRFGIVVTDISVRVGADRSRWTCWPRSYIRGPQKAPRVTVPARGSRRITLRIAMSHRAPDACQRATLPMHLSATASMG